MMVPAFEDVRSGYSRIQGETDIGEIDLADADKLEATEDLANEYLAPPTDMCMVATVRERYSAPD